MKRKGFTLIELLAVILILGIIDLIAIPLVNNIIAESRKESFKTGIHNIVSTIENTCQLQILKGETLTTTYTFTNGVVSPSLNIKGNLPSIGTATVDSTCNVALDVSSGNFRATKIVNEDELTITKPVIYKTYANGTAVYFNPVTGAKCPAGESGCMKWYAFNDNGRYTEQINLIYERNTTAAVAWNSSGSNVSGPVTVLARLKSDTSSWVGVPLRTDIYSLNNGVANYTIDYSTYRARLISAQDVAKITGHPTFDEKTSTERFFLDSNNLTQVAKSQGASKYAWLYDYTDSCVNNGCNVATAGIIGYWSSTAVATVSSVAWYVSAGGDLVHVNGVNETRYFGVRPVITISKTIFE